MGQHRRKKRSWQSIEIDVDIDIGTAGLAAKDLVAALMSETADDNFIATSVSATYTLTLEQAAQPNSLSNIAIGLAKSDYSAAEVETWIENSTGFKRADLVAQEISRRMIKNIGTFMPVSVTAAELVSTVLNDGLPIKTRLNWRIVEDTTLLFWVYNGGENNVVISGNQKVRVIGQIRGFWEN